jgi:nondiscriminating glutamyl-tRNA synthetase
VAEFRQRGYLPEALVNYLALLGWSPGENEEIVPASEMARRFDLGTVSHSAAVFDMAKLAWMNRHYLKAADPGRVAELAMPGFVARGYVRSPGGVSLEFVRSLLDMAVGSVDRLEEIPERVSTVFDFDAPAAARLVLAEAEGARVVRVFADTVASGGSLDREAFRAAASVARQATGLKGRGLFHPIRVALTGADSGPELDLLVPAIDRGAALAAESGVAPIQSCRDRLRAVLGELGS